MAINNSIVSTFRQTFTHTTKDVARWFPGHMASGMKKMQEKLRLVDCIIEVHDARIPFSGRNPNFYSRLTAVRPHILVLNKMDLCDMKGKEDLVEKLKEGRAINHVIFTNCKQDRNPGLRQILPKAMEFIENSNRFNREAENFTLMVIGVPNVGKSSLINQLRSIYLHKAKATMVGATPGVTRRVLEKIKMHEDPPVYLFDTPGILAPNVTNMETGMKLAACAILKDHLVGEDIIADYILYMLNKSRNFRYVKNLNLKEPNDDIMKVLLQVALNLNKTIKVKSIVDGSFSVRPNLQAAAAHIITAFRAGDFGPVNLDRKFLEDEIH